MDQWKAKLIEVGETYPWYTGLLGGRQAEEFGSLQELPLITSAVLEAHYYHQTPDPALAVYRTSGTSSGRRKAIFYSEEDDRRYVEIKTRLFGKLLEGSGCRRALADMGTGHAASTATAIFDRLGLDNRSISFELPIERHIEALTAFRPDLLYTMPSILDHIVYASGDPRAFGIRKIILVGEIAPPQWQRNMAQLFGLDSRDVIDTYGSIEIGTIAYYSHDIGRYLLVDNMIAEGIGTKELGEALEPLGADESVLVLTSLVRSMLPALRFVTYDVVRDLRPVIVDGVEKMSFQSIVKRVGRELKHGEKISVYDIEQVVYRHLEDAMVRVKMHNNALVVAIQSKSATEEAARIIQKELGECIPEIGLMIQNRLLGNIRVTLLPEGERMENGQVKNKKLYY
ncbi:CoF synthetase [Paenibacillus sp. GD4]|uniref:CoF synthetase n=1 Tax=Paenibacillus sp. GD4 TaxID=3068890 RepID=UPI0027967260|nr:CoF synthetase [Paenibacillus sp. GD4]MDQ1911442.1 CoF synthetase [Paenibacillus sp. GD4]